MKMDDIIEGLEKLKHTLYKVQSTVNKGAWDRAIDMAEEICKDSKYYLSHLKALRKEARKPKPFSGLKAKTVFKRKGKSARIKFK